MQTSASFQPLYLLLKSFQMLTNTQITSVLGGNCIPGIVKNLKDTLKELNVQTYDLSLHLFGSSDKVFELELNHLAAILHVYAGVLNFMK